MSDCFCIHFDELKVEVQKQLLKFMGVDNPAALNWDVFAVAYVFRTNDIVDDVKREKRSYDLPRGGCIWDLGDDNFTYLDL
jgi:hypothetical protein